MMRGIRRDEKGFTLIELMVVVLIIAILIAVAIPTFLGARKRAQDRATQSSVRNVLTAAKTLFADNDTYTPATATALGESEPSLCIADATTSAGNCNGTISDDPREIVVVVAGTPAGTVFRAGGYSKSGTCWYLQDTAGPTSGGTGLGTTFQKVTGQTSCAAASIPTTGYTQDGWTS